MPEWFATRHLGLELTALDREVFAAASAMLCGEALAQPVVFVHRDYHSRNLMVLPEAGPGIIDFQDALAGPVGYDLVSLLKDCYIRWPRAQVEAWLRDHRAALCAAGAADLAGGSDREFLRWFDLIGVQRHIKVLGIFARLCWRDGKTGYLDDLPLTLEYTLDACARHPELASLGAWLQREAAPRLAAANARARVAAAARAAGAGA
jgi:aminoglycoside/choline kinase family phosphotransferase